MLERQRVKKGTLPYIHQQTTTKERCSSVCLKPNGIIIIIIITHMPEHFFHFLEGNLGNLIGHTKPNAFSILQEERRSREAPNFFIANKPVHQQPFGGASEKFEQVHHHKAFSGRLPAISIQALCTCSSFLSIKYNGKVNGSKRQTGIQLRGAPNKLIRHLTFNQSIIITRQYQMLEEPF